MTDKAQEIADGLRNYIAEPRRAELAGDIREALEAKEAECERLREHLSYALREWEFHFKARFDREIKEDIYESAGGAYRRARAALKEET